MVGSLMATSCAASTASCFNARSCIGGRPNRRSRNSLSTSLDAAFGVNGADDNDVDENGDVYDDEEEDDVDDGATDGVMGVAANHRRHNGSDAANGRTI